MGWSYYEIDGRPCGYSVEATCDFPGCEAEIDRGLAYLCGDLGSGHTCGGYFCGEHRTVGEIDGRWFEMCHACAEEWACSDEDDFWEVGPEPPTRWERLVTEELVPSAVCAADHLGQDESKPSTSTSPGSSEGRGLETQGRER